MNHKLSRLVPLSSILVEDRLRVDLGEVMELAESMRDNGVFHPPVVEAIPQEVGFDQKPLPRQYDYRLLAGGRRHAAFTLLNSNKVENAKGEDWTMVPVTVFDELPEHQRVIVEVEENIKRKEMTWQETLAGIVKYHNAKRRVALQEGDNWSQVQTGRLLNMNQAKVSIAFKVHDAIKAGNQKVIESENLNDAIKVLLGEEQDRAQVEQMRRINLKRAEQAKATPALAQPSSNGSFLVVGTGPREQESQKTGENNSSGKVLFTPSQVASFYHHGNALEVLPLLAKNTVINHIVCDPPYGIDMDNLTGDSIERIAETHDVKQNLELLPAFLKVAYDAIAEDGFLCMWYDLDHHEKIALWAKQIGWKVTRWPLVWCKTSQCQNNSAQCNVTKATEVCYFFRRSEKSIIKTKQLKNYILASSVATSSHPFPKPHEVWKYLIETVSTEGQNIVDPFAGEGSSLASMFKLGRVPVGIEVDEKHIASGLHYVCEQINQRNILDDVMSPPL